MQQFFYDEQIRRFLLQITRVFSNFQVEYGRDEDTNQKTLYRVPVRYGDATRQAQTIIQQNSANALPSTPLNYIPCNKFKLCQRQNARTLFCTKTKC